MYQEQCKEALPALDYILFTNAAAASYNSAAPIDMSKVKRAYYIIQVGTMAASATLDGRLQSCQYSSFNTAVHNITGTNLTQIVNTGPNVMATIEVRADQVVQGNAADKFVRLNTTVGTAAVNYGAIGIGVGGEQKPESQYINTTIVTQNVVCNV